MGFFRDSRSQIPIPGIRDRDFLFWARSKNPENPEIPGIFYPRDRDFFSWDGISRQKATSSVYNQSFTRKDFSKCTYVGNYHHNLILF